MALRAHPVPVLGRLLLTTSLVLSGPGRLPAGAVDDAIDRGIEYLLGEIDKKQTAERGPGQVALETYALVVAGVSVNHRLMKKNFEYLKRAMKKSRHTYSLSCYIFALDAAIAQLEHDLLILEPRKVRARFVDDPRIGKAYRPHLEKATRALVELQNDVGAWRYGPTTDEFDNSNVQFAVLGLGVGAKRGVPIDPEVWRQVADHFLKYQQATGTEVEGRITLQPANEDRREKVTLKSKDAPKRKDRRRRSRKDRAKEGRGQTVIDRKKHPEIPEVGTESIEVLARGWSYTKDQKNYRWNMTCSGLSSLLLARDNLRGEMANDFQEAVNKAIRDGYGWVMRTWTPTKSYYGIYSLEKVADIGGVKLFDGHDWYTEISGYLVGAQRGDGSWPKGGSHGEEPRVASSFALLVLNRATSLLTMNPVDRIMISGKGGGIKDPNDRSWVYVPDLEVTMHYPTLLRTIRRRPNYKLIKFLRNIVDNYPLEWKGELIPEMAKVRDAIPGKKVQGLLQDYLSDITGYEYRDWEKYLVWHRRWSRVMLIGSEQKTERIPDLIKYYENTSRSMVLKKAVIWALIQCKAREALPLFLDDLGHKDAEMRLAAYRAFRNFFIAFPPAFDAGASKKLRNAQVTRIKEWYERQLRG
ncbi:MAG: hypothetical protein O7J95_17955 [Planctomycetota bacterium]|nr:hypothetical protein [Planctomycetota bacterium]